MTSLEDRKKKIDLVLARLNKSIGEGAVMRLGDAPDQDVEVIPTGSLVLDLAVGVGGFPRGRVIEIFGPESSGKSLLTLHAIAEVQKSGGIAAFIDAEYAFNAGWAKKIGVNTDDLYLSQPGSGEEAFQVLGSLVETGSFDLIIVDSVAALVSRKELDGEVGDAHVGLQARMMSQGLRMLTGEISKSKTTVIFINQLRSKIGVTMPGAPTEDTAGGKALKYFSSMRLEIRRIGQVKEGEEIVGAKTRVKVVKNKFAAPFKIANFDIIYKKGLEGVSREGDIIDLGVEFGFVKKSGSWYTYEGEQLGQGKEKARLKLKDEPALADKIEKQIKDSLKAGEIDFETDIVE